MTPSNRGGSKKTSVVDADVHVQESAEALEEYCEQPWDVALRDLKQESSGLLTPPVAVVYEPPFNRGQPDRTVKSPSQLKKDLDGLGIDKCIIFPDELLTVGMLPSHDYAMALVRAYNRWLVKRWLGGSLFGALCTAPQDPVGSADEIRRFANCSHIACVVLPTAGIYPLYGHRWYEPIYEAAEKAKLPVALHSAGVVHPVFPFNLEQFETMFAKHAIAHPFSLAANLVHMITNGVPLRFPNLRIAFIEGGISWVPWIMMRLDKEYVARRRQVPFLKERPSDYIRKFRFGSQPIEEPEKTSDYAKTLELMGGPELVMFASDWPHFDFDHPRKLMSYPLSENAKEMIMSGNATKFFSRIR